MPAINKTVPDVDQYLTLTEPAIGTAFTDTVRSPWLRRLRLTRAVSGRVSAKQGTPKALPTPYYPWRHVQESDLGGRSQLK